MKLVYLTWKFATATSNLKHCKTRLTQQPMKQNAYSYTFAY